MGGSAGSPATTSSLVELPTLASFRLIGEEPGDDDRVIVHGMTAVALRRWLRPETRDRLYEPFTSRMPFADLPGVGGG